MTATIARPVTRLLPSGRVVETIQPLTLEITDTANDARVIRRISAGRCPHCGQRCVGTCKHD